MTCSELIKRLNCLLGSNFTHHKICDFLHQRVNENALYLNLGTRRLVGEKTARSMVFYDEEQKVCARDINENTSSQVIQILASLNKIMTPEGSPKEETPRESSPKEKKVSDIFTKLNNFFEDVEKGGNEIKRSPISAVMRKQVWLQGNGKCYCCQASITESFFECGHIVPHKFRGENKLDNLRAVCQQCNDKMGTMYMHEFTLLSDMVCHAPDREALENLRRESKMLLRLLTGPQSIIPLSKEQRERVKNIITNNKRYYYTDRRYIICLCTDLF